MLRSAAIIASRVPARLRRAVRVPLLATKRSPHQIRSQSRQSQPQQQDKQSLSQQRDGQLQSQQQSDKLRELLPPDLRNVDLAHFAALTERALYRVVPGARGVKLYQALHASPSAIAVDVARALEAEDTTSANASLRSIKCEIGESIEQFATRLKLPPPPADVARDSVAALGRWSDDSLATVFGTAAELWRVALAANSSPLLRYTLDLRKGASVESLPRDIEIVNGPLERSDSIGYTVLCTGEVAEQLAKLPQVARLVADAGARAYSSPLAVLAGVTAPTAPSFPNSPLGSGVTVFAVDTGFQQQCTLPGPDRLHSIDPKLAPNKDPKNHGTGVMGIISLEAPRSTRVGVRLDLAKDDYLSWERAFSLAVKDAAPRKVVNASFGPSDPWPERAKDGLVHVRKLIQGSQDTLFIVAVGNDGNEGPVVDPLAGCDEVVAVGFSNASGEHSPQSTRGRPLDSDHSKPDIICRGLGVVVARSAHSAAKVLPGYDVGYTHCIKSGSSIAAPRISALAAVLWSKYPKLTARELKAKLLSCRRADLELDTDKLRRELAA